MSDETLGSKIAKRLEAFADSVELTPELIDGKLVVTLPVLFVGDTLDHTFVGMADLDAVDLSDIQWRLTAGDDE